MNILVTGASGQLGLSIRDAASASEHNFIFSDIRSGEGIISLDITDAEAVSDIVRCNDIDVIINCAAYTDVNGAESAEGVAGLINEIAPRILAEAALASDALLIHVSTDYVFDGKAYTPYTEDAEPSPVSVYGKTKLAGERAIASTGCRYIIFRTAWLYSNYGKNFYKTMISLTASRPSINVVADQVGTPTNAADLADAIMSVVGDRNPEHYGIYHYSDEGVCSWYDFAKEICSGVGHLCDVRPCRTADYPTPAVRPHYSVLDKTKFKTTFGIEVPHWRESLLTCISCREV